MTIYHYIVLGIFVAFVIADHLGKRTAFPHVRYWRLMGAASFVLYFVIGTFAPFVWDGFLGGHQLFDGSSLPFWAQVLVGFLVVEFGIYFWHRTMHAFDPIWRQRTRCIMRPNAWISGAPIIFIPSTWRAGRC